MTKNSPDKINSPITILQMGAVSGLLAQTVCYPLDTIRRRSETYGKHYSSIGNAISTIIKKEGFAGFYKGMAANSIKIVPNNFIRFYIFEQINPVLKNICN